MGRGVWGREIVKGFCGSLFLRKFCKERRRGWEEGSLRPARFLYPF